MNFIILLIKISMNATYVARADGNGQALRELLEYTSTLFMNEVIVDRKEH